MNPNLQKETVEKYSRAMTQEGMAAFSTEEIERDIGVLRREAYALSDSIGMGHRIDETWYINVRTTRDYLVATLESRT